MTSALFAIVSILEAEVKETIDTILNGNNVLKSVKRLRLKYVPKYAKMIERINVQRPRFEVFYNCNQFCHSCAYFSDSCDQE